MAKISTGLFFIALCFLVSACSQEDKTHSKVSVFQTSRAGDKMTEKPAYTGETNFTVELFPEEKHQEITGFGGAFTESTAHLLQRLSPEKRQEVLAAYFADTAAAYSLCRTHINSCDFSLNHYSYAPVPGDTALENFSIEEDRDDIIPTILAAKALSESGFKLVASPWTAPPWMKDNQQWEGGKLLPEYYDTWARFLSLYVQAYQKEGIDIWALTVENEPLGNNAQWESMHYTHQEMAQFVAQNLGPQFKKDQIESHIFIYDQNKGEELIEYALPILEDPQASPYIYGTAVHWYNSTVNWFPESLQETHASAPQKHILATEACIDAEVPHWQDDDWYWRSEATDWGYDYAPPQHKENHPQYVPVYRYARDIIGSLNNWVEGWIDWNMVLDKQGGPNWAENWCIAPVIADTAADELYYTPLYYVMSHFSKFIRPGAKRIGHAKPNTELMLTAVENKDGSVVVIALNMEDVPQAFSLKIGDEEHKVLLEAEAISTILLNPHTD